jgi:hypothetical protein
MMWVALHSQYLPHHVRQEASVAVVLDRDRRIDTESAGLHRLYFLALARGLGVSMEPNEDRVLRMNIRGASARYTVSSFVRLEAT